MGSNLDWTIEEFTLKADDLWDNITPTPMVSYSCPKEVFKQLRISLSWITQREPEVSSPRSAHIYNQIKYAKEVEAARRKVAEYILKKVGLETNPTVQGLLLKGLVPEAHMTKELHTAAIKFMTASGNAVTFAVYITEGSE